MTTTKQSSDAEIATYTVGELKPHDATINIVDYDPACPDLFSIVEEILARGA